MNFITEQGYDVKKGQAANFQKWLTDNEEKLAASAPDGVTYVGTFANIFSSEKDTGAYRTIWALDSYGDMDAFADAMKQGGPFASLVDAMVRFTLDVEDGGNWSNVLSRKVTTAAIWGDDHDA